MKDLILIGGEIIIASIDDSNDEMVVTWSTNIADIVNIIVTAKNTVTGSENHVIVRSNERKVSFGVDIPANYSVTVTVFDICQQNFSSAPRFATFGVQASSASEEIMFYTSASSQSVFSPIAQQRFQNVEGINIALPFLSTSLYIFQLMKTL